MRTTLPKFPLILPTGSRVTNGLHHDSRISLVLVRASDERGQRGVVEHVRRTNSAAAISLEGHAVVIELPPRLRGEDRALELAMEIRDELLMTDAGARVACASFALSSDEEAWLARERASVSVQAAEPGDVVVTRAFYGRLTALSSLSIEPVPATLDARFRVRRAGPGLTPPRVGRWVSEWNPGEIAQETNWIEAGFLALDRVAKARDLADEVHDNRHVGGAVVVVAEAWMGKTFSAHKLRDSLEASGARAYLTDFERTAWRFPDDRFLQAVGRSFWIVNAADEAHHRGVDMAEIGRQTAASKHLTTIVFLRPDSSLDRLQHALRGARCFWCRLLPLAREDARRELGLDGDGPAWERVLDIATSLAPSNSPRSYPELRAIQRATSRPTDLRAVRRAVLEERCRHRRLERVEAGPETDELLRVAARLAAITMTSGVRSFHFGDGPQGFDLRDVLRSPDANVAWSLRDTGILQEERRAWRFAATHLEEDLAAEGLRRLFEHDSDRAPPTATGAVLRNLLHDGVRTRADLGRVVERLRELLPAERLPPELGGEVEPALAASLLEGVCGALAAPTVRASWLSDPDLFDALASPGVERYVPAMLGAASTDAQRFFMLQLALKNRWRSCAPLAEAIALDESRPSGLRSLAAYVAALRAEGADVSPGLVALVQTIPADTDSDDLATMRAHVLCERLRGGFVSSRDALGLAANPSPRISDARGAVVDLIVERLDLPLAREIVDQVLGGHPRPVRAAVLRELATPAARLVIEQGSLDDDLPRFESLVHAAERFPESYSDALNQRLDASDSLRRTLYERLDIGAGRNSTFLIITRDSSWLVETLVPLTWYPPHAAGYLFRAWEWLSQQGDPSAAQARSLLERQGLWEETRRRTEETRRSAREWRIEADTRASRQVGVRVRLEQTLEELLSDGRGPNETVRMLGELIWGQRHFTRNVFGSLADLSEDVQRRIFARALMALRAANPSDVPSGRSLSVNQIREGATFRAAILHDDAWLDEEQARRWVGLGLATATSLDEGVEEVVRRCHGRAPLATRAALREELERWGPEGFVNLGRVPRTVLEDADVQGDLVLFVHDALQHRWRKAALEVARVLWSMPEQVFRGTFLAQDLLAGGDENLRREALGVWFACRPGSALGALLDEARDEHAVRTIFAVALVGAHSWESGIPDTWPIEVLGPVAELLATHIPRDESDAPDGCVADNHRLADLRDRAVSRLIREGATGRAALHLERVLSIEEYANWAGRFEGRRRVTTLLSGARHPRPTPAEAASVLRGELAIAHNAGDLALWVTHCLRAKRDRTDMILLYATEPEGARMPVAGEGPAKEPATSQQARKSRSPRKSQSRLHERHLQAFLRKELEGALVARGLSARCVVREPEEEGSDKPDLIVQVGDVQLPIEVKWSDHDDLSGRLVSQLVLRYMRRGDRPHGVYFVAWNGTPSRREAIREALDVASDHARVSHDKIVHVVVEDFRYSSPAPSDEG